MATTSPSSAVQEARAALGRRLREMRKPTGLSARALAARAGWHESKASRIENGKTLPSDADLQAYATLCGVPEKFPDLVAAIHGIEEMYVEWHRVQATGMRQAQLDHVPLYVRTQAFKIYEPGVIPGLLQVPEYARAIMRRISGFRQLPDDVDAAVEVRMSRQRYLRDGHRHFDIVLEETALHSRFGDEEVMAAQLGHLLQIASMHQVSLGVIPMNAERIMWPLEGFWIFDDQQVIIELATAQVTVRQPSEIQIYSRVFAELVGIAVYGKEARALLAKAINSLG